MLLLFSSSQAEEPLILVHFEFSILVVEFEIVALFYLDLSLFIKLELFFLVRTVTDVFLILTLVGEGGCVFANCYQQFCIPFLELARYKHLQVFISTSSLWDCEL